MLNDKQLNEEEGVTQPSMIGNNKIDVFCSNPSKKDMNQINENLYNLVEDNYSEEEILDNATIDLINYLEDEIDLYWDLSVDYAYCITGEDRYDRSEEYVEVFVDKDDKGDLYYTIDNNEEKIYDLEILKTKVKDIVDKWNI